MTAAWFGPKGFASVVYGLLVLRSGLPQGQRAYLLIAGCIAFPIVARSSADGRCPRPPQKRTGHRARELAQPRPTVTQESPALDSARLLADRQLPRALVLDARGAAYAIVPASRDLTLAAIVDEQHADRLCDALEDRAVAGVLPKERMAAPVADTDGTVLEVAALMARERSPPVGLVAPFPPHPSGAGTAVRIAGRRQRRQAASEAVACEDSGSVG